MLAVMLASVVSPSVVNADEKNSEIIETAPGISIDTSQYFPKKLPAPAILIAHGFGGSKESVDSEAKFFASKGFVGGRSFMPKGLIDAYTDQQVADLLAFIQTLK